MTFILMAAICVAMVGAFVAGATCQQHRQHREPFTTEHPFRDGQ